MNNYKTATLKAVFGLTYRILYYMKGILPFLFIVGNLTSWIGPLFFLALLKLLVPLGKVRFFLYEIMTRIYLLAVRTDDLLLWRIMGLRMEVRGMESLYRDKLYLVLANHQSWTDILILQSLLSFKTSIPKFIVKKQVLYVPLVGLICWAYDCPVVRRYSKKELDQRPKKKGQDRKTLQSTLKRFHETPGSIVNFVEGTRYSLTKANRSHSPYRFLFSPKVGGLCVISQSMGDQLHQILDLTLAYDCPKFNFWISYAENAGASSSRCVISLLTRHLEKPDMTSLRYYPPRWPSGSSGCGKRRIKWF
jgi:1-acyl-sn-glycerol-3-phosphate acyltransferase